MLRRHGRGELDALDAGKDEEQDDESESGLDESEEGDLTSG